MKQTKNAQLIKKKPFKMVLFMIVHFLFWFFFLDNNYFLFLIPFRPEQIRLGLYLDKNKKRRRTISLLSSLCTAEIQDVITVVIIIIMGMSLKRILP
jgi:hypothetical protein